jgi:hypothetical protein
VTGRRQPDVAAKAEQNGLSNLDPASAAHLGSAADVHRMTVAPADRTGRSALNGRVCASRPGQQISGYRRKRPSPAPSGSSPCVTTVVKA